MFLHQWLHQLAKRWCVRGGKRHLRAGRNPSSVRRRVRPRLEVLEERLTPTYDVLAFSVGGATNSFSNLFVPNQPTGAISVQLQDNNGNAITATSNLTVKLNSSSNTGEFLDLSGKQLANSSLVIPAGSSFALFEYEDSQTGSATVTGQTFNPSAFGGVLLDLQNRVAFTTPKQTLTPGQPSQPITVQLQDANGNPVNATSAVTVSLISSSSGGKFLDSAGSPLANNSVTIAAGSNSASFEYEDNQTGLPTLTASTSTGASGFQNETVQYSLAFTTPLQVVPTNQATGPITIQLQDSKGNAVAASSAVTLSLTSFSSTGKLLDTSGNPLPSNGFGGSSLTIAAGSSSASFEYEDSQAQIATIQAIQSATAGQTAQQQVYVGQQMAITTPAQSLTTGSASQPITVQLGSAATSAVTLNLSSTSSGGQFLDTSGQPLTNNSLTIAAGASSASFEYEDSQIGLPTITVAKSDFSAFAEQQENVGVSLKFTTAAQTVAQGQLSQPITIQLQGSNGQPFTPTSSTFVQLSSANGGQFFDASGNPLFSLTIPQGSSSASFEYKNQNSSGTDTITTSITNFGSGSPLISAKQQVTVTPSPFSVTFVTPKQTIAAGQPSQPITVQLQSNGSAFAATNDLTINLSSSSTTGQFLDTSGKSLTNNSITIAAGSNSASFEYEDSQEWFPTLTASVSGSGATATQQENVGGVSLVYATTPQTITAGQPSGAMKLTFQDSSGKAVNSPINTSVVVSSNSGTGKFLDTTGKPLSFNSIPVAIGSSSASFEYEDSVGGKPTITAFLAAQIVVQSNETSQQETVTGPYNVQFTTAGQTIAPNQASQPITVSLRDSTGNPATATSDVTVSLSTSSSGGQFLDTSGNALPNKSITIAAGSGSASFEYKDSSTGLPTLTASENGLSSQQTENVGLSLAFTTSPQTLSAGQTSQTVTVQLQDNNGHAFNAPSSMTLDLSSDIQGVQFLDSLGNALSSFPTITIGAGSSSASFEFKSTWGGTPTLTASTAISSTTGSSAVEITATQKETVQGLAALVITTSAQTLTAGQTSQLVTLKLEDNNGNAANAPTGGLSISLFGGAPTLSLTGSSILPTTFFDANGNPLPTSTSDTATLIMPAGSSTVSFEFESNKAGGLPINASVQNGFSVTQNEVIQTAAPNSVVFTTPAPSLPTGTASGSITVQLEDKFGNVIQAGSGGLTFNLSSSSSGGQFLSVSGDPLASPGVSPPSGPSITIPQGAGSATFEYEDSQSGTPTLTVTASGVSGTQQLTITAASADIHVTNTNDSGTGSLRAAITAADNNPGSTIVFDSGVTGTIDLLSELPNITANTNILGPGANVLTIERGSSATGTFGGLAAGTPVNPSVFVQPPEPIVLISGLTVANFNSSGISNYGTLTLRQVDVSKNQGQPFSQNFFSIGNFNGSPGGIGNFAGFFGFGESFGTVGGTLTVLDSTIANNSTTNSLDAAGIDSEGGSVIVINSTVAGNVDNNSNSTGGIGIYGGTAFIANSTISGNSATQTNQGNLFVGGRSSGGGIDSDGAVTLYNTIVAGNNGSLNNPTDVSGTFHSLGFNLIGKANNQSSGFVSTDQVGTTTTPIDPKLGALGNNGGPTPTMALLNGSPAIAAGSSANAPATDQRGDARPTQGAIDIGAVEVTTGTTGSAPSITGSPSNLTLTEGQNANFTASATGTPTPTVQWQVSTDNGKTFTNISGATSTSLTVNNVTAAMNGNEYVAVFSNSSGTATTSAATLTVQFAPKVMTNPSNQTVLVGQNATFTAAATGNPTPSVQWQVSTDNGSTFSNLSDGQGISGSATTTLTLSNVTSALNNEEFRAVFSNTVGTVNTSAATLTVSTIPVAPSITGQPKAQTVTASQSATFTASASGSPTPTVVWQVSTDGGKTFTPLSDGPNVTGSATTTLMLSNVTAAMNNNEYEAFFSNSAGNATTNAAALTVQVAPTVTTNPTGASVTAGQGATFTAAANANPSATVQWQVSADGGKTFTNLSDGPNVTGSATTTLTLNNATAAMNGNEYQAVFTNSVGSVTTSAATLAVQFAPIVTTNPSNQSVTQSLSATFTAAANANPSATVQWQVSNDGGKTFTPLSDGPNVSGSATNTLTLSNVTQAMSGNQVQAIFTNAINKATTSAATLTVTAPVGPVITGNPSSQTLTAGQTAIFTASASGSPTPTVQWQVSTDGGATFTNIDGATSTTLTLSNATTAMSGNQYQAFFTNIAGNVTSATATLTVNAPPPPAPTPPAPPTPPVLQPPPLLQFLNSLFGGGTVTVNANGTETVTDGFFGIPLFVSTFDSSGKLVDVTFFGIDITFLFFLL